MDSIDTGLNAEEDRILSVVSTGVTIACLATFPGWHEETDQETGSMVDVRPFPSRKVSGFCTVCMILSTLFSLTAATWQHAAATSSASVVEHAFDKGWDTEVGSVAAGLVWASFFINVIVMIGLIVMNYSIAFLDRLTDDWEGKEKGAKAWIFHAGVTIKLFPVESLHQFCKHNGA
jgi:hypothetical protein